MPQPIPYLAFDGNCADAMRFYAKVLGGKLDLMTFGQSPMADQTPPSARDKVMHARLSLERNGSLYAAARLTISNREMVPMATRHSGADMPRGS
jgi:PhnB protein